MQPRDTDDTQINDVILLSAADDFFVASASGHAAVSVFLSPAYADVYPRRGSSTVLVPWQPPTTVSSTPAPVAASAHHHLPAAPIAPGDEVHIELLPSSAGASTTADFPFEMREHLMSGLPLEAMPTALSARRDHFVVLDAAGAVTLWRVRPDALIRVGYLPPLPGPRCPPHAAEIVLDFKESGAAVVATKCYAKQETSVGAAVNLANATSGAVAPGTAPGAAIPGVVPSFYGRPRRTDDVLVLRDFETTERLLSRRHTVTTPFGDEELTQGSGIAAGGEFAPSASANGHGPPLPGLHSASRSTKRIHTLAMYEGQVVCCVEDLKGRQAAIAIATAKPPLSACTPLR